MNHKQYIDANWCEFRKALTAAYQANSAQSGDAAWNTNALRDYTENCWHDDLQKLLDAETANERQHRNGAPDGYRAPISLQTAAKLILMQCAAEGANKPEMIPASHFLVYRKTAMEAEVIGFIARDYLRADWRAAVLALDYAKIMGRAA